MIFNQSIYFAICTCRYNLHKDNFNLLMYNITGTQLLKNAGIGKNAPFLLITLICYGSFCDRRYYVLHTRSV